jgi:predicted transcriptional regulator
MSKEVVTHVIMLTRKEVSEDDAERLMAATDSDSLHEVARDVESDVEALLSQTFSDAEIGLLEVTTQVRDE